jgi:hypothetical protein
MKFRFHRGSLKDSMETLFEFEKFDDLLSLVNLALWRLPWDIQDIVKEDIQIHRMEPDNGKDDRIGWKNTKLISIKGYGVIGMAELTEEFMIENNLKEITNE